MDKVLMLLVGLILGKGAFAAGNDVARGVGAAAGIFAGIYVHELGHAVVLRAAGATDIRIRVPAAECTMCGETNFRLPDAPSATTRKAISVAGFVASNAAAELLLQHEGGARTGFGQGLVATNLYSNVAHVVSYYTKVRGKNGYRGNDIDSYELAGGNPHLLSAGLVAYSLYALHRMHKKEIPVLFVRLRF